MRLNHRKPFVLFAAGLMILGCEDDSVRNLVLLDDLEIEYLAGTISANLMPNPLVPPRDPIYCRIDLLLTNGNPEDSLTGLTIPSADVFLDSTGELLGEFPFSTNWDRMLEPGAQDTVRLTKDFLDAAPFEPPCNGSVYLVLEVRGDLYEPMLFTSDTLFFGCVF